jgi:hypothetical protein
MNLFSHGPKWALTSLISVQRILLKLYINLHHAFQSTHNSDLKLPTNSVSMNWKKGRLDFPLTWHVEPTLAYTVPRGWLWGGQ